MKQIIHYLCFFILVLTGVPAAAAPQALSLPQPIPRLEGAQSEDLILQAKYTGEGVKLRWLLKDKSLDHTYLLFRAPARAPKDRTRIAELKPMDFDAAKALLAPTEPAALKLIFPQKTAQNRAEYNASLGQTENRLNLLAYLSILNPRVAHVLGQSFEDRPPAAEQAWLYTLEVHNTDRPPRQITRGILTTQPHTAPSPGPVTAHRFHWGVGLKWEGYDDYVGFHIFRSPLFQGPFTKITDHAVQVQAARNPDGTVDLAPYFYSDTQALEQGGYYKVQGLDFFGDAGPLSPAVEETVKTDPRPEPLPRPTVHAKESHIEISWSAHADEDIVGYNVYRSFNYNKTGEKLNPTPLPHTRFTDSQVIVDTPHFYAVTAVDRAGYESLPSLAAQGIPKDSTPPPVPATQPRTQMTPKKDQPVEIDLTWTGVQAPDLLGYRVYRTLNPQGLDWALLNGEPLSATRFTDSLSPHLDRYPFYYRITSVDTHYNESAPGPVVKIQLPDVTPPRAPAVTQSRVTAGRVSLAWQPVTAHDLAGYRIYRKTEKQPRELLVGLGPTLTAFQDVQPPQGQRVSYAIAALDRAGNSSPVSRWIQLQVTDAVPPQISQFTLRVTEKGVEVQVQSPDTDTAGFDLLRSRNGRDFIPCNSRRITRKTTLDPRVLAGKRYFYQVVLWDWAGNTSQSPVREIKIPR